MTIDQLRCPADLSKKPRLCLNGRHAIAGSSIVRINGPNGSGKTTMLRVIAGLETDYSGVCDRSEHSSVRYVPTEVNDLLLPWYSVEYNAQVLVGHGGNRDEAKARFERLLSNFFPERSRTIRQQPAYRLSAGERAAIACACGLACTPSLLLLDESLSHLGVALLDCVVAAMREYADSGGIVLFVGHHLPPTIPTTLCVTLERSEAT